MRVKCIIRLIRALSNCSLEKYTKSVAHLRCDKYEGSRLDHGQDTNGWSSSVSSSRDADHHAAEDKAGESETRGRQASV